MPVNIMETYDLWLKAPGYRQWESIIPKLLKHIILVKYSEMKVFNVELHLISDAYMQELNLKYMGKDSPTNVLSFPLFNADEISGILGTGSCIGDIFLSYERIRSETHPPFCDITFFDKCSHLFVHGVLHLLGMDHTHNAEADAMENLEVCVLESFGVKNPYVDMEESKDIGEIRKK
ncbi:MAG: rRNA maturation RNase YbeY [Holosporales bacterium]|jgi:probable rRNA maturation factor|nr:rRNA maturation RNase YbeY [Holosporales bacterium]